MSDKFRKTITIPARYVEPLTQFAAIAEVSVSSVLHGWIEAYVEYGSGAESERDSKEVQVWISSDLASKAEARARAEGLRLRDVIRHELAMLSDL